MAENEAGETIFGDHRIKWTAEAEYGVCQVCGRVISREEVADDRNKDCEGGPPGRGRAG